jgi:hypothetical protein
MPAAMAMFKNREIPELFPEPANPAGNKGFPGRGI